MTFAPISALPVILIITREMANNIIVLITLLSVKHLVAQVDFFSDKNCGFL
jgi:hypothetical protein